MNRRTFFRAVLPAPLVLLSPWNFLKPRAPKPDGLFWAGDLVRTPAGDLAIVADDSGNGQMCSIESVQLNGRFPFHSYNAWYRGTDEDDTLTLVARGHKWHHNNPT